ncbi:ABC transporter permease [sulfur-oxidizing endosymbiont of Gigantopelta aegis]|uniref:ABC transporter permease n=1 Tax=sulfur-oxidizing endosymbiont of Gigantopelta aegis TaxID=2794934 RepID=UPI0018DB77DC|nr:ABC transporter permease [sulfur-oxidizing endosymbiont of Gigantopelta aegis]
MFYQILAVALKEFQAILRDKQSRLVLIGPPIAQLLIFGYAATFDLNNIPVAIYNQDNSQMSRELVSKIEGSPHFEMVKTITKNSEIAPLILNKKALMVVHINADFMHQQITENGAHIQVIVDGRNSNTALLALNYIRSIVINFNQNQLANDGKAPLPAVLKVRSWFNPNLISRWFIIPGIVALMTLVVPLIVTALSVAREREAGTFDQILVTPLHPVHILIGKSIPGVMIGLIEGSVIMLFTVLWFEIPFLGNLGALYIGLVLFLLSTVGIGLMISSLSATQQQGLMGAFLFLVPAVILSGFATPIENMPALVQDLTYLNPMRYFLIIVRGVYLEGNSYADLMNLYWPMALIGLTSLTFAGWLFKHRMY